MFEKILKGARSGMPGAGGVKNPKVAPTGNTGSGYFATHSEAMASAHEHIKSKGYEVSDDNWFQHVAGTRKPGEGKTNEYHLPLHKDGKETDKYAHVQVYNRGNNVPKNYELNAYVDSGKPKVSKGEEGFAAVMKGARSGQPGAGGVKHPGMKQKDPDADLVSVGDSWNGGDGSKEKMHAIPKPPADLATVPKATLKAIGRDLKKQTGRGYTDDYMYPFEAHQSEDGKRVALVTRMGSVGSGGLHTGYMTTLVENDGAVWKHKGTVASDYKASWSGSMSDRHVPSIISKFVGYKVQDKSKSKKNEGWRGFFGI